MIIVAGENVADLIAVEGGLLRPALGGGPANTAVAAARLGAAVSFAARFGADAFGRAFRERLAAAGVDLSHAVQLPVPSSLALATIDESGAASYDFWLHGAADFSATPLPGPAEGDILHIGSLAAYLSPGADVIEDWVTRSPAAVPVTLDVNLRPIVLAEPGAVARLDRLVQRADVVKASDEDLQLAYPETDPEQTARRWLDGRPGPKLVVLTLGAHGALGLTRDGERVHVPAPRVEVADTIGAGDALMGALLAELAATGVKGLCDNLDQALRFVTAAAALACTKPGAYAPTRAEVEVQTTP
jgi:fructokinase